MAWIFSLGRFRAPQSRSDNLRNIFTDFLVKIIDDFRHLLALIIVVIFALALGYAMLRAGNQFDNMTKALQAVVSTLGGLIGSIIGYYFGESTAQRARRAALDEDVLPEAIQQSDGPMADIQPAPPPPPPRRETEDKPEEEDGN